MITFLFPSGRSLSPLFTVRPVTLNHIDCRISVPKALWSEYLKLLSNFKSLNAEMLLVVIYIKLDPEKVARCVV